MINIKATQEMDIRNAIDYGTAKVYSGHIGFFINTQFGTIPVEVKRRQPEIFEVGAVLWKKAERTKWVINNLDGDYKWHVTINMMPGQSIYVTRMQFITAFVYIMYAECCDVSLAKDDLLTLTREYIIVNESKDEIDYLVEYGAGIADLTDRIGSKLCTKSYNLLLESIARYIKLRFQVALDNRFKIFRKFEDDGFRYYDFGDSFYDLVFAMGLYNMSEFHDKRYYSTMINDGNYNTTPIDIIKMMRKDHIK